MKNKSLRKEEVSLQTQGHDKLRNHSLPVFLCVNGEERLLHSLYRKITRVHLRVMEDWWVQHTVVLHQRDVSCSLLSTGWNPRARQANRISRAPKLIPALAHLFPFKLHLLHPPQPFYPIFTVHLTDFLICPPASLTMSARFFRPDVT